MLHTLYSITIKCIRCEIDGYNFWENNIEKEYEINIKEYCFERDLSISMEDYDGRFPERFARLIVGSIVCENKKNKWRVSKDKRSLRFRWGSYGKYRKNKSLAYKIDICDEGEIIFSSIEVKYGPFRYLKTPINPDKAYAPHTNASNPTDKTVANEERKIAGNINLFNWFVL